MNTMVMIDAPAAADSPRPRMTLPYGALSASSRPTLPGTPLLVSSTAPRPSEVTTAARSVVPGRPPLALALALAVLTLMLLGSLAMVLTAAL